MSFNVCFLFSVQRYGNIAHTMFASKIEIIDISSNYFTNIVFAILIFLCTSKTK